MTPDQTATVVLPPVPTSRDELLIAALRHANEVSGLLNRIGAEVSRLLGDKADDAQYDALHELLRRRFLEDSGVFLFIAAGNLGIEMPDDLIERIRFDDDDDA